MSEASGRDRPYLKSRFRVAVDGFPETGIAGVEGLERPWTPPESAPGPLPGWIADALEGIVDVPTEPVGTLTLTRGVGEEPVLWNWQRDWTEGGRDRRAVTLSLLDGDGEPGPGWVCTGAEPVEWVGPTLGGEGVATERLALSYTGLRARADPPPDGSFWDDPLEGWSPPTWWPFG